MMAENSEVNSCPCRRFEELLASLETLSKEEILVKAFARGATVGFSRGLAKRNELIGELIALAARPRNSTGEVSRV